MSRLQRLIRKLGFTHPQEWSRSLHSRDAPNATTEKLPLELINRILFFTAPQVVISARRGQNEGNANPWMLAQVCSAWRAIVLADANMWTHIVIPVDFSGWKCTKRLRRGCIARLRRSLELSYPLSISFHLALAPIQVSKQQGVRWPENLMELLSIVYAERFRVVSLDLPNLPFLVSILERVTWDQLTELTLTRFSWRLSSPFYKFTAPCLRQITVSIHMISHLHEVDWTQITNLIIETCTVDGQSSTAATLFPIDASHFAVLYRSLYKAAGVLETLEMRTPITSTDVDPPASFFFGPLAHGPPWTFLKLRYLSILSASKVTNDGQESRFLDMISCPALEILYVESATRLSEFTDFIRHGTVDTTLHTLILGKPLLRECASESWASLLEAAPSLRTIVLVGLQVEHPLVDALLHRAVDDQLQRIFLVDAPDPGQSIDEFSRTRIWRQVPTPEAKWADFVAQTTDAIVKMGRHSTSLSGTLGPLDPTHERRPEWRMLVRREDN